MIFAVRKTNPLLSYGENITVHLGCTWAAPGLHLGQPTPASPTELRMTSALVFGWYDWGCNRKNVEKVLAALSVFLDQHAAGTRLPG
jgi:hypothetical protein